MATISIALVALCFLGMGLYGLAAPARLIAPWVELFAAALLIAAR